MSGGAALAVVVVTSGVVRALALRNDLWLDELWTLWHVTQLRSVGEIFSRFIHDNNHPLNSLWIYLVMPLKTDWLYRILSWAGGTVGVWLAAKIARLQFLRLHPDALPSHTRAAELITAALFGSSYLLVVYSSEARGYGPALGFGLLGIYALFRGTPFKFGTWTIVYWGASVFALLAHAITYQLMAAGLVFTVLSTLMPPPRNERAEDFASQKCAAQTNVINVLFAVARWHAVPLTLGFVYYVTFFRRLEIVGGPETPLVTVLGELAAYSTGLPASAGVSLALPLLTGAALAALVMVSRRSPALACFHLVTMILFSAAALAFSRFVYLFPRYFILNSASALLLVGYLGALSWRRGTFSRWLVVLVTGLIVGGNLVHAAQLLRYGRGGYKNALRYIAARTPPGHITLSSDHDGRNVLLIHHHAPGAIEPRPMEYQPASARAAQGTQWLLIHRLDHTAAPGTEIFDERGNPYQLEKVFLHAPPSGWDWYLYRNKRLLP